jgi:hypothetical protein
MRPKVPRAATVAAAAASGDEKALLVALRDRIARAVSDRDTPARDLSSSSRRLLEVSRELAALQAREAQEAKVACLSATDEPFDGQV